MRKIISKQKRIQNKLYSLAIIIKYVRQYDTMYCLVYYLYVKIKLNYILFHYLLHIFKIKQTRKTFFFIDLKSLLKCL